MIRRKLILLIYLASSLSAFSQEMSDRYQQVINLNHEPGISTGVNSAYLDTFHWFLTAILNGDEHAYNKFYDSYEQTLSTINEAPDLPENRYFAAEVMIQSGFLKLKFGHELAAAWTMKSAYKQARENYLSNPENPLFLKSWGLMQVLIGAIPDNYQWLPELFGVYGSIPAGITLLQEIPDSHWVATEAECIVQLTRSYLLDESSEAALAFSNITDSQPGSPVLDYLYLSVLVRAHSAEKTLDYYKSLKNPLDLSTYIAANAALQGGHYKESRNLFTSFITTYTGDDFKKDATYKLFLSYYLDGDEIAAREYFSKINSTGATATEADRYAQRAASRPLPDIRLMKIRLLTDGGYYDKAQAYAERLSPGDFNNSYERTEFIYRSARLMHHIGNTDEAANLYLAVIDYQEEEHWYFAPNSCLQLGYIYLENNQTQAAEEYFRMVTRYRSYEYQKGIERKAHSALVTHFDGS